MNNIARRLDRLEAAVLASRKRVVVRMIADAAMSDDEVSAFLEEAAPGLGQNRLVLFRVVVNPKVAHREARPRLFQNEVA